MKRIISLFLALALLFSLAPAVFAEGAESNEQAGVALVLGKPEKENGDRISDKCSCCLLQNTCKGKEYDKRRAFTQHAGVLCSV